MWVSVGGCEKEGRERKEGGNGPAQGGANDQDCGRQCWLLHKITKPTPWRSGAQILEKEEEEDAKLLDRCEAKRKESSKHWQCNEEVQNVQDKPWKNEELRRCEEALRG